MRPATSESFLPAGVRWQRALLAIVALVAASLTALASPASADRTGGELVRYDFTEGSGTTVADTGSGTPLDLTIANPGAVTWVPGGGLTIDSSTTLATAGAATKVNSAVAASGAVTVEAWVAPANTTQAGPARMVAISGNSTNRNVTLAQGRWGSQPSTVFDARVRTTSGTNNNGEPATTTPTGSISTELQHVVFTRATNGTTTLWIDGEVEATETRGGTLSNWNAAYPLRLGNEAEGNRPWLGTFCQVAIYDVALTPAQVAGNHDAGCAIGANTDPTITPIDDQDNDEGASPTLQVVAEDAEDDTLTYAATGLPDGLAINPQTGLISGTISQVAAGSTTVVVTVDDGRGGTATTQFTWDVDAVNQAPVLDAIGVVSSSQGVPAAFSFTATDPDGDGLSFSADVLPDGLNLASNGAVTGTPTTVQDVTVTVTVTDGDLDDGETFTWSVVGNSPPVVGQPDDQSDEEGDTVSVTVSASDIDGDDLTFSAVGLPAGLSIGGASGAITGTVAAGAAANSPYTTIVTVDDGFNDPVDVEFLWTITEPTGPDPLVRYDFFEGSGTTVADTGVGAPLNLTIANPGAVTWVAGGGLTIDSSTTLASAGAATKVNSAVAASGAVTVEAWVAPANTTQDGPARMVAISGNANNRNVTLAQGRWGSQPSTVFDARLRTTSGANNNGQPATTTPTGSISTELQHVVFTRATNGTTTLWIDGQVEATETRGGTLANWNASYPLRLGNEAEGNRPWVGTFCQVAIYDVALDASQVADNFDDDCVVGANTDPTLSPVGDQANDEGDTVEVQVAGNDVDGDDLTFAATGLPAGLSINAATGAITGSLPQDAAGSYSVVVTVDDGRGGMASTSFGWTVDQVNVDPVLAFVGDQLSSVDVPVSLTLSATDEDGDTTDFDATGLPDGLSLVGATIQGTPTTQGTFDVTVSVADGNGGVDDEVLTWTVIGNDAPVLEQPSDQLDDEGETVSLDIDATDPDDDTITYDATGLPPTLTIDSVTGVISGTLSQTAADGSPWAVEVTATDDAGAFDTATFTWTVNAVNVLPEVTNPGDQANDEGDAVSVAVAATDADDDVLTWSASGLPTGLAINGATGAISGTIAAGAATGSPWTVTVSVTDDTETVPVEFDWTVTEVTGPAPLVRYDFLEGSGATVGDAGDGSPLDLTIANPGNVTWIPGGGLTIDSSTTIASTGAASKVNDAVAQSGSVTVEAWIAPTNITQDGPARIVSVSEGALNRNVTLAQGRWSNQAPTVFDARLRTTSGTNSNGQPATTTPAGSISTDLQHVVFTRSTTGTTTIWIDGVEVETDSKGGTLANWAADYPLLLGNEAEGNRPWLGTFCQVAIYDVALDASQVADNFDDGCGLAIPGQALVQVTAGQGVAATTFGNASISITNQGGPAAPSITSVAMDLRGSLVPDATFDPIGTAGDEGTQCLAVSAGAAATGFDAPADPCTDPFSLPHEDAPGEVGNGWDGMTLDFTDFGMGETIVFGVDIDPTTIQGVPGSGGAGAVSGLELTGSPVVVTFSDGSQVTTQLFGDGSAGGGQAVASPILGQVAPTGIEMLGVTTSPTVFTNGALAGNVAATGTQTVRVSGPVGADVTLLSMTGEYPEPNAFDLDPYESDEATAVGYQTGTIGAGGTVDFTVAITSEDLLSHFVATIDDGATGLVSDMLVIAVGDTETPVVAPVNDLQVVEGTTASLTFTATDPNGDNLTLSLDSTPDIEALDALFNDNGDGTASLEWATETGDAGSYVVDITASDGTNQSTESFTITVVDGTAAGGTALVAINSGGGIESSTFTAGSFAVTNTSTLGQTIQSVSFDLSTAVLPDIVFDPVGLAGDATAKCLVADGGAAATGFDASGDLCVDPFTQPHNGVDGEEGYNVLTASFDGFGQDETFQFSVDIDPTSIKDVGGAGNAGSVSGFELSGSTVTIVFSDGTSVVETFRTGTSSGGSSVATGGGPRDTVALAVDGVTLTPQPELSDAHSAATVGATTQTIVVTGPANTTARLVRIESALVQTPGYDVDAYEANKAVAIEAYDVALDATGVGTVEVTLTDTATGTTATDDTGLNYFMAVVGAGEATGPLSNIVVLDIGDGPVAVDDQASMAPGEAVTIDVLANDTSDVGLDPSTVTIVDGPSGGYTTGPDPVTGAITYNGESGFDNANGDSFAYTVADLDGTVSNVATVTIDDETAVGEVLYRVNAGGPEVAASDGGAPWTEDQSASAAGNSAALGTPSEYVNWDVGGANADTTYGVPASTVIDLADVVGTGAAVEALYETERYREPATGEPPMTWTFPVSPGDYEVTIFGAEVWTGEAGEPRVMDVAVEGTTEVEDLRWSDLAGGIDTAEPVTIAVTVADDDLVVELLAGTQNPKLSAIEVRSAGPPPMDVPPTVAAIEDQTVQVGSTLDIPITTSEVDGDAVSLSYDAPVAAQSFTTLDDAGDGTGTLTVAPGAGTTGTYQYSVTATDVDGSDSETFVVTVTDAPAPGSVFARINAGGPQVAATDGGPDWEADQGTTGHPFLTDPGSGQTNGFAAVEPGSTVPSTTPGVVFDTERWSSTGFTYGIDVPAGTQAYVRLFLGNGYDGTSAVGERVYDVSIDGDVVADDLDLVDEFGNEVGGMLEYLVTSDGTVDITFSNVVENPLLNGLEVVSAESAPGQLGVSPTTVNFGQTLVGGTQSRTITLSNLGFEVTDPSIDVTSVDVGGAEFGTDFPSGGITLAAGASATFDVTFQPTNAGPESGSVTVNHDGTNPAVAIALSGVGASDIPVSFGSSGLSGESSGNPTSLEFGPDGRLYVSQQNGFIYAYEVERNGPNDYDVVSTEQIDEVKQITNHDDDGTVNNGQNNRQVTGLMTAGTATNPVLYVTSSDPRIGAGGGGNDLGLDTNSGVLSRVTWTGTQWDRVDLVRGLPRSEENHATNGIDLDPVTNTIYLMQGGHANKGAPSNNFAGTSEYYLSAAMLSIDLDQLDSMSVQTDAQGNDYVYDLPTLDDPSRDDTLTDPFGGNNGLNQAVPEPGGPVQIYSPGYRNAYDVVFTTQGRLYTSDNGPNTNWGGLPLIYSSAGTPKGHELGGAVFDAAAGDYCTNDFNEGGSAGHGDPLHFVDGEGYYGGHPTPIRAFPGEAGVKVYVDGGANWNLTDDYDFADLLPSGLTLGDFPDNPVECTYSSDDASKHLDIIGASTNGITEYTASNFGGAMLGNILTAAFNGNIYRYQLNAAGDDVLDSEALFGGFGSQPLDVTAQGDAGPFPGTVWSATYGADTITVFEPGDYNDASCTGADDAGLDEDGDGYDNATELAAGSDPCNALSTPDGGVCTGADDAGLDEDNDGYDNADELAAGTDPCNGGSQPDDNDDDGTSDVTDTDDDNDGVPDTVDAFAIDATNGIGTNLPVQYPLENEDPGTGIFGLGFTGLMTNGTDTWIDQYDGANMAAGGAVGALTVEQVPVGDAYTGTNTQEYAFQYGVDVDDASGPFVVHTQVESPFFTTGGATETPENYQSNGVFIGTGTQDDYLKLVFGGNTGAQTQVLLETGGAVDVDVKYDTTVTGDWLAANQVDLYLEVDPAAGTVQPRISLDSGTTVVDLGTPVAIPATWLDGADDMGLAVGIIATANGSTPFAATWDFLDVVPVDDTSAPAITAVDDVAIEEGATDTVVADVSDADGDSLAVDVVADPDVAWLDVEVVDNGPGDATVTLDLAPQAGDAGTTDVTISADDGTSVTTEEFTVTVTEPVTPEDVLFRVNTGGDEVAAADGSTPAWASDSDAAPSPYRVAGGDNVYLASSTTAHTGPIDMSDPSLPASVPVEVFEVERWDADTAPEMLWQFPVDSGTEVEVRLYFAELFGGVEVAGDRLIDVAVEGTVPAAFSDIDQIATAGPKGAFMVASTAVVDGDGLLDVELLHDVENPALKGIEVLQLAPPPPTITLDAPSDGATIVGDEVTVSWTLGGTLAAGDHVHVTLDGDTPIEVTPPTASVDLTGVAEGAHTITVEVVDGTETAYPNGDASDSVAITTTTTPIPQDPLEVDHFLRGDAIFRVNAGGAEIPATDGGVAWSSDLEDAESSYLTAAYLAGADNQKNTSTTAATPTVDATVPAGTPTQLFSTERWDPPAGIEMSWLFPVTDGTPVEVRLYFADFNGPTQAVGARVFDVAIEGDTVLDDFDIFVEAGANTGTMRSFVAVADGDGLGIDFTRSVENTEVRAIEIIELVDATTVTAGDDVDLVTTVTNPATNTQAVALADLEHQLDGPGGTTSASIAGDCDVAVPGDLVAGATATCRHTATVDGATDDVVASTVTISGTFSGGQDAAVTSDDVAITLTAAPTVLARINAGGGIVAATDDGPDWQADEVVGTGPFLAVASGSSLGGFPVPNRTAAVPAYAPQQLYQTERWDGTNGAAPDDLTWEIPVEPGATVTVNLFMANGWDGSDQVGERQFDVFLEGVLSLDEFDLVAEYGHAIGGVESFDVTDDGDGVISIILEHGTGPQNPLVNAIEVRTD